MSSRLVVVVSTKGGHAPADNFGQAHAMDRPTWWKRTGKAQFERKRAQIMAEESAPDWRNRPLPPVSGAYQLIDRTWSAFGSKP